MHKDRAKWDERYRQQAERGAPPAWLADFDSLIPRHGRALDVAAGVGRIACWAANRGLHVTAVDISSVGLGRIAHPEVATVEQDLELDPHLPVGPFQLVTMFHYRQASLGPALQAALDVGGVLLIEIATVQNLERHAHPSARWLAAPGEVRALAGALEVISYDEGWLEDRHTARLVARRSDSRPV
jgi:SAM-dependent methyltransferase